MNAVQIDIVSAYDNTLPAADLQAYQESQGLRLLSPQEVSEVAGGPEADVSNGVVP
jgi:hypothetical protein